MNLTFYKKNWDTFLLKNYSVTSFLLNCNISYLIKNSKIVKYVKKEYNNIIVEISVHLQECWYSFNEQFVHLLGKLVFFFKLTF